jgi:hypothetical protein
MRRLNRKLMSYFAAFMLAVATPCFASATSTTMSANSPYSPYSEAPTAGTMLADTFMVRPLMLVGTAAGVVTFVVTLPFSALGGNVGEAGQTLVVDPAKYTFVRPLGQF